MNIQQLPAQVKQRVPAVAFPPSRDYALVALRNARKELQELDDLGKIKAGIDRIDVIASYAKAIGDLELDQQVKAFKNDCWLKIGQLGLEIPAGRPLSRKGFGRGFDPDPHCRNAAFERAGIKQAYGRIAMRLASASPSVQKEMVEKGASLTTMGRELPRRASGVGKNKGFQPSDVYSKLRNGLAQLLYQIRRFPPPVPTADSMSPEEAIRLRPDVLECIEWLDAFEQRLPKER